MPLDQNTIILIVFGVLLIILLGWIMRLETKMKRLLIGSGSKNLDDSMKVVDTRLTDFEAFKGELEQYLQTVEKRLRKSVQGIHTLRYNPFKGSGEGGNQSFVTAFINEEGDGVVISSLYSREHVSVFSKAIKGSKSEFELTAEEQEALNNAKSQLKA